MTQSSRPARRAFDSRPAVLVTGASKGIGAEIAKGLAALELCAGRAGGPYFLGATLSMADLFIVPQLYNARRYHVELAPFPRLREIEAACLALPAFRAAQPENQPDSPPL